MSKRNGAHGAGKDTTPPIATADDFKQAIATYMDPPERVLLPKLGKYVIMQKPHPMWFLANQTKRGIPTSLANSLIADKEKPDADAVMKGIQWTVEIIMAVMVSPKVSLTPGPDEISPDLIHEDDLMFIVKWATGRVGGAGEDLDTFRKRKPDGYTSLAGEDSQDIPQVTT